MTSTEQSCLKDLADRRMVCLSALLMQIEPHQSSRLQQLSPSAYAYIGDAVYELYVRTQHLLPAKRLQAYHAQVVAQVRAESQAHHLQALHSSLTEQELDIVRRGRNTAAKGPKRLDPALYQQATGLEALLGYLYLFDPQRLVELLSQLQFNSEEPSTPN